MPRLRRRFTVRRWMILVAVVAVVQGLGTPAWRWHKAWRRLAAQQAYYAEGRITIDRLIGADRQVRDAELACCWTRGGKIAVLAAHIDRAERMVAEERRLEEDCLHCHMSADVAEVEGWIEEDRDRLRSMSAAD